MFYRLLAELGYTALHASSHRRVALMGSDCGVFLGMERPDWAIAQPPSARRSVYAVTGDNVSVAAGRLSFMLGLQGPCASVDTACASALVAMHGGANALRGGECANVLALAASVKLVPHGTLGVAMAGMLSADGRCKTLDARANGYARSEGVGALVLTRGDEAAAATTMLLGGSAVRQDGRSASLTAPNGSAQRTLLLAGLDRASVAPGDVGSMEAHGTGTPLGDPTETGALAAVHGAGGRPAALAVGAAKASVGHSEAASGQVGLLKVRRALEEALLVGNAQLRVVNPLISERLSSAAVRFLMPTQSVPLGSGRVSCVSSFGYSGTIAHAVLRCAPGVGSIGALGASLPPLVYHRRAFPWRDAAAGAAAGATAMYATCWSASAMPQVHTASPVGCGVFLTAGQRATQSLMAQGAAARRGWQMVVVMLADCHSGAPSLPGTQVVLALAQQLVSLSRPPRVLVLTRGARPAATDASHAVSDAAHGGVWGVARVLRLEHTGLHTQSTEVSRRAGASVSMSELLSSDATTEAELAWGDGTRFAARLR